MLECNHHQEFREIHKKFDSILRAVKFIVETEVKLMATLDQVLKEVTAEGTQLDSLSTLVSGLEKQVAGALAGATLSPTVQAQVDAVFAQAQQNTTKIATALNSNVPAPAPVPASLAITPSPVQVAVGATQQLAVKDASGVDQTANSSFTSSDSTVATVSPAGLVTAVKTGSAVVKVAQINAAAGATPATGTVNVTVA